MNVVTMDKKRFGFIEWLAVISIVVAIIGSLMMYRYLCRLDRELRVELQAPLVLPPSLKLEGLQPVLGSNATEHQLEVVNGYSDTMGVDTFNPQVVGLNIK